MKPFTSKHCNPINYGSPLNQGKVDPDAPGTPGKPGYEPPVVREELSDEGKKIYDNLRRENDSLLKSGMTQKQINIIRLKKLNNKKGTK